MTPANACSTTLMGAIDDPGVAPTTPGPATTCLRGSDMAQGTCSIAGCERDVLRRDLCNMHYIRQLRGRPMDAPPRVTHRQRSFWDYVDAREPDECWEWQGKRDIGGYGTFYVSPKLVKAHRRAYELEVGPIPEGMTLDHLCVNPACVNPAHLEPCTLRENIRRRVDRKTHCKRGHEFTPENTYVYPAGRACRQCAIDSARERYARLKAGS